MSDTLGTVHVVPKGNGVDLHIYMSNFSVNRADLKTDHRAALDRYVLPILTSGGSASIYGIASRTGTWKHNLTLSSQRAFNAQNYVKAWGTLTGQLRMVIGTSESYAAIHQDDGTESAFYRAVWMSVSPKRIPPPPPPPPKIVPVPSRYKCVVGKNDKEYYDWINGHGANGVDWLFKGAEGNDSTLHLLIKRAEQQYRRNPASGFDKYNTRQRDDPKLGFYKSTEFRLWYTEGACGLERFYKDKRRRKWAFQYIYDYNTVTGQKKKKVWDKMMTDMITKPPTSR